MTVFRSMILSFFLLSSALAYASSNECEFVTRTFLQWIYRSHVQNVVADDISDEMLVARVGTVMRNFDAPILLSRLESESSEFGWDAGQSKQILDELFTFDGPSCDGFRLPEFTAMAEKHGLTFEELLLKAFSLSLDPHSTYYTKNQMQLFAKKMNLEESKTFKKPVVKKWQIESDVYAAIKLSSFYKDSYEHIREEIRSLKENSVKGLILDLRDNIGGQTEQAVDMLSLFLGKVPMGARYGLKLSRNMQAPEITLLESPGDPPFLYRGQLIILINGGSGSASEIFAAAIQDYRRGVVIGPIGSFGKGSVQEVMPLGEGAIKVTTSFLFRPNGQPLQQFGVKPDIIVGKVSDALIREKDLLFSLKSPRAIDSRRGQPQVEGVFGGVSKLQQYAKKYKAEPGDDQPFEAARVILLNMVNGGRD